MRDLSHLRWDFIGLAEMNWAETLKLVVKLYKVINSGEKGKHTALIALVLLSLPQKCILGYRPVSVRIMSARF